MKTNLEKFYETIRPLEIEREKYSVIINAALELANAEMQKGNKIATDIFLKK